MRSSALTPDYYFLINEEFLLAEGPGHAHLPKSRCQRAGVNRLHALVVRREPELAIEIGCRRPVELDAACRFALGIQSKANGDDFRAPIVRDAGRSGILLRVLKAVYLALGPDILLIIHGGDEVSRVPATKGDEGAASDDGDDKECNNRDWPGIPGRGNSRLFLHSCDPSPARADENGFDGLQLFARSIDT